MTKKFFSMTKNDKANMPQEPVMKSYPKKDFAIMEGGYVDTQPELDSAYNKAKGTIKKFMRK